MIYNLSTWSRNVDATLKTSPDAVEKLTSKMQKTVHTATAAAVIMGFTADEWGVIAIITTIVVSVATAAFNAWFKMRYQRPKNKEVCDVKED